MEKLLTVAEVAECLAISKSLVYDLVSRGEIAYISVGRSKGYRFAQSDIETFIQQRRTQNQKPTRRPSRTRLKHIKI
ncbi:MAG: helix-turn-helix domain-containing protein [Pirellulales bacterium]|nr:helix-turn-helix domain-containing protein [Pirellulales bacterium]